jgi:aryl-alcohol dehydrogenase-like predicted oxidoreductase
MATKRLVFGTAQLGSHYGIANRTGKPDSATAVSIIQTAWESGIREFDTASVYGNSERVLGNAIHSTGIGDNVRVISKVHPDIDHVNHTKMTAALHTTLSNLNISALYGIMIHREELLDKWDRGLYDILRDFQQAGLIQHIGVSVYSPAKAVEALETEGIEMVQLPTNIFDRRFEKANIFDLADHKNKTLYIRSIFLQGLLLLQPDSVPSYLQAARHPLEKLLRLSKDAGLTVAELCVGYIKHAFPKSKLVIGVETPSQVRKNIEYWHTPWPMGLEHEIQNIFTDIDERILNPSVWLEGVA